MTFTSVPVEVDSSVTDWPFGFATQMWVPVEAEISVTDLPRLATQTCVPSEVMAHGSSNPHPRTLTPVSGLSRVDDAETREAFSHAGPIADVGTSVTRVTPDKDSAPTATARQNRPDFTLTDGPLKWTKVHHIGTWHETEPAGSQPLLSKGPVLM